MSFSRNQIKILIPEIVYILASVVFLFKLNRLNQYLLSKNLHQNAIELLIHNNYEPLRYFLYTLILGMLGIIWIIYIIHSMKYEQMDFKEMTIVVVSIFVNIFVILLLVVFINNPILRAVFSVLLMVAGGGYLASSKNN